MFFSGSLWWWWLHQRLTTSHFFLYIRSARMVKQHTTLEVTLNAVANDKKTVNKALRAITRYVGVQQVSYAMDMKILTFTCHDIDPVQIISTVRKVMPAVVLGVGPPNSWQFDMTGMVMKPSKCMKVVLKLNLHDDIEKEKAVKIARGIEGVDVISMDKDMKLTVTGDIDPVKLTGKLRKLCNAEIVSVRPTKQEKKDDKDKEEEDNNKKEDSKDNKKGDDKDKMKEDNNKKEDSKDNKKGDDKDKRDGERQQQQKGVYLPYPQFYPLQSYKYGGKYLCHHPMQIYYHGLSGSSYNLEEDPACVIC